MGTSLRTGFSWALLGNVVFAASQWGMVVAVARTGTPANVGQFALGLAISSPVIHLTNCGLRPVLAVDVAETYTFGQYLRLRLVSILPALALVFGIASAVASDRTAWTMATLIAAAKCVESVSDIYYGLMQRAQRQDFIARSQVIRGPLSVAALYAGTRLTGSVVAGILGWLLSAAAVLFLHDQRAGWRPAAAPTEPRQRAIDTNRWKLRGLLRATWLLGVSLMLMSLGTNIPRLFVERYRGASDLGVFAAMTMLISAGGLAVGALCQSAVPVLANYFAARDARAYGRLMLRMLVQVSALGVAAVLGAIIAGPFILRAVYGPAYAAYARELLPWLIAVGAIGYLTNVLFYGMTASQAFRAQAPIFLVSNAICAVSCLLLLPRFGLYGATAAIGLAAIFEVAVAGALNYRAITTLARRARDYSSVSGAPGFPGG
jgi:O-antigen/teichoic acid export membrane protein